MHLLRGYALCLISSNALAIPVVEGSCSAMSVDGLQFILWKQGALVKAQTMSAAAIVFPEEANFRFIAAEHATPSVTKHRGGIARTGISTMKEI